jgi:ribonuclease H2 subunit A
MLDRNKTSLNLISNEAAIELIANTIKRNINLKEVYVDTVGNPEKYQTLLSNKFPKIKFTVTSKADDLFPVVSAASIAAKVTRDTIIDQWDFIEGDFSKDLGSGYPSDPYTKKWLAKNIDHVFGFPSIVRFSWKTTTRILKETIKPIKWENYNDDNDDDRTKKKSASIEEKVVDINDYYSKNNLLLNFKFY